MILMINSVKKSDLALQRVVKKIESLLDTPADFEMTRWIFDWDETKSTMDNIENAHSEQSVLIKLQNFGCIKLRKADKPVPMGFTPDSIRYKNEKLYNDNDDYKLSNFISVVPSSDRAWRNYDWAVWVIGFDIDKFRAYCMQNNIELLNIVVTDEPALTNLLKTIGKFNIYRNNIITYEGRVISLQPQVSKIVALIISRSIDHLTTSREKIADECLSEEYKEKASTSQDEDLVFKYVRRCISDARRSFKATTGLNREYFYNTPGVGYMFKP